MKAMGTPNSWETLFRPAAHVISDLLICLPAGGHQAGGGAGHRQPRRHQGNVDSGDPSPAADAPGPLYTSQPASRWWSRPCRRESTWAVGSQLERRFIA